MAHFRLLFVPFTLFWLALAGAEPLKYPASYLVFAVPNKISTLDPLKSANVQTRYTVALMMEALVRINSRQELEPALADSWTVETPNKTLTLKLKAGHVFSDGTVLDAQSVYAAFQLICSPESENASELSGINNCLERSKAAKGSKLPELGLQVIDKNTLRFTINLSPTLFLYQLSSPRAAIFKKTRSEYLGSGAYVLESSNEDEIVLKKSATSALRDQVKNPGLVIRFIDENKIQEIPNLAKQLDGTLMYRVEQVSPALASSFQAATDQSKITLTLAMNIERFPFSKKIVRQALAAEIYNRGDVQKCMQSSFIKAAYGIIPLGLGGSLASAAPDKVKEITPQELFKAVPQLRQKNTHVTIERHIGRKNRCEEDTLKTAFKKFGIQLDFNYHKDYSTLWPRFINHDLDAFLELFVFLNREAYVVLRRLLPGTPESFFNVNDPQITKLIYAAWYEPSSLSRFQVYKEINQYMLDQAYTIPIHYESVTNLINKCLEGLNDDFYFNPFFGLYRLERAKRCEK